MSSPSSTVRTLMKGRPQRGEQEAWPWTLRRPCCRSQRTRTGWTTSLTQTTKACCVAVIPAAARVKRRQMRRKSFPHTPPHPSPSSTWSGTVRRSDSRRARSSPRKNLPRARLLSTKLHLYPYPLKRQHRWKTCRLKVRMTTTCRTQSASRLASGGTYGRY